MGFSSGRILIVAGTRIDFISSDEVSGMHMRKRRKMWKI
jgi:hypothetical protein